MYLTLRLLCFCLAATCLGGCDTVFHKTDRLGEVHAAYRADFQEVFVPVPSGDKGVAKLGEANAESARNIPFSRTLQAMRDYRAEFGDTGAEAGHLTVLEGMIYLQSRRFGMAQSVSAKVDAAASSLTAATGGDVRDKLFAENFQDLLAGWRLANRYEQTGASFGKNYRTIQCHADNLAARISGAAESVVACPESDAGGIRDLDGPGPISLPWPASHGEPAADEGALYIGTTAAIFYLWAHSVRKQQCGDPSPDVMKDCVTKYEEKFQRSYFLAGCRLVRQFLGSSERSAALSATNEDRLGVAPGRERYLAWYRFLSGKAGPCDPPRASGGQEDGG